MDDAITGLDVKLNDLGRGLRRANRHAFAEDVVDCSLDSQGSSIKCFKGCRAVRNPEGNDLSNCVTIFGVYLTALLATKCLWRTPESASGSFSSPSRVSLPTLAKALLVGAKRVRGEVPFRTSAVGRLSKAAARAATRVVKRSSAAKVSSKLSEPEGVWEGTTPGV